VSAAPPRVVADYIEAFKAVSGYAPEVRETPNGKRYQIITRFTKSGTYRDENDGYTPAKLVTLTDALRRLVK
jgi:hypothetical protein